MIPPKKIPKTKNKFQSSFFQSYLKKLIFEGIQAAQICLSDELIPKDLFPRMSKAGTVSPINGPAIYHGQGSFMISTTGIILKLYIQIDYLFDLTTKGTKDCY